MDTHTCSVGLPFDLVDPILVLAARLIRPTDSQTRGLPPLDTLDAATAATAEPALVNLLLVIHPSPTLCSTLLPRLSWFKPDRTLTTGDVRFVDTWARSKSVVPFARDIPLDLGTWCFAHAAPAHVLDWLVHMSSLTEVVSDTSITKLFDTTAGAADGSANDQNALRALQWWAGRVPIEKDGLATRVKQAIKQAARAANVQVLDWLWARVPRARFDCVLDGATRTEARDPEMMAEWWARQYQLSEPSTSLDQWMRQGQRTFTVTIEDTAIDSISARGCIPVLDWWRHSPAACKSQLQYTHRAVDAASEAGNLDVLKWWQSASSPSAASPRLELKYSELAMDKAASPAVLDWWLYESNLPLKFTSSAATHTARKNNGAIFDWWLAHSDRLGFKFSPTVLHDTMDCFLTTCLHRREIGQVISQGFLLTASVDPSKAWLLPWWSEQGLPVEQVVHDAIKYASSKQWHDIMLWWNSQATEIRERKAAAEEGSEIQVAEAEKHPVVVKHETKCMKLLQTKLNQMDPAAAVV